LCAGSYCRYQKNGRNERGSSRPDSYHTCRLGTTTTEEGRSESEAEHREQGAREAELGLILDAARGSMRVEGHLRAALERGDRATDLGPEPLELGHTGVDVVDVDVLLVTR